MYQNVINLRDKIIVCQNAPASPMEVITARRHAHGSSQPPYSEDLELPKFSSWADMTYVQMRRYAEWAGRFAHGDAHRDAQDPPAPTAMILDIVNPSDELLAITKAALNTQDPENVPRGTIPQFPGVKFSIGSPQYNTLLSTPENVRFAELIVAHKRTWGAKKILSSVRIFRGARSEEGHPVPVFYWRVKDDEEKYEISRREGLKRADTVGFGTRQGTSDPVKPKPMPQQPKIETFDDLIAQGWYGPTNETSPQGPR